MRKAEVLSGRMWTGVELLVTSAKSHAPYSITCSLYVLKVYVPVFYVCKVRSENYGEMWSCVWWWCVTVLSHNVSCWSSSGESPACTMCCETVERFLFNICVVKQSRDSCLIYVSWNSREIPVYVCVVLCRQWRDYCLVSVCFAEVLL